MNFKLTPFPWLSKPFAHSRRKWKTQNGSFKEPTCFFSTYLTIIKHWYDFRALLTILRRATLAFCGYRRWPKRWLSIFPLYKANWRWLQPVLLGSRKKCYWVVSTFKSCIYYHILERNVTEHYSLVANSFPIFMRWYGSSHNTFVPWLNPFNSILSHCECITQSF